MRYNRWHVYEKIKRTWRESNRIMTAKELATAFPRISKTELSEGIIEFELAHKHMFQNEQRIMDQGA